MKLFYSLALFAFISLCSCNGGSSLSESFYGNSLKHVTAKDSACLNGKKIPQLDWFLSNSKVLSMEYSEGFLMFYTYGTDTVFTVFSTEDWAEAGKLFPNGKGTGKLYSPLICGIIGNGSHSGEVSLIDDGKFMSFNLPDALKSGNPELNIIGTVPERTLSSTPYDDNTNIVQTLAGKGLTRMFLYLPEDGTAKDSAEIYKGTANSQYTTFESYDAASPDNRKIAMALSSVPVTGIFDAATKKCKFMTPESDLPDLDDLVESGIYMDTKYYEDIATGAEHIYCIYCEEEPYRKEIHVFDWEGNFVSRLTTGELVYSLTVDEENNRLFAITEDDGLYCYNLPGRANE